MQRAAGKIMENGRMISLRRGFLPAPFLWNAGCKIFTPYFPFPARDSCALSPIFAHSSFLPHRMTSSLFTYDKPKVIQALRFHFINRREIKFMIILINVFAIVSGAFYFMHKINPLAFLLTSALWFVLMIAFWFVLPGTIYRRASTFKDRFKVSFEDKHMFLENDRGGSRSWPWTAFSSFMESPHFFHLYFDSRSFFLIPKESFEGDDVHDARKMLKAKIKSQS